MAGNNNIDVAARDLNDQRVTHESSMGEVLKLWRDVGEGLDKHGAVVWTKAVDSLSIAHHYLRMSADARSFVDKRMCQIIRILLEEQPARIGNAEKECVKKCLECSLRVVDEDIKASNSSNYNECPSIEVLELIFCGRRIYYRPVGVESFDGRRILPSGLPESMIEFFRRINGSNLVEYLETQATTPQFPSMSLILVLLKAFFRIASIYEQGEHSDDEKKQAKKEAFQIANATMKHIRSLDDTALKGMKKNTSLFGEIILSIFSRWFHANMADCCAFWRALALKMVMSSDLSMKLVGWDLIRRLIDHSVNMRPPPRAYIVSGAGTDFVNGRYDIDHEKIPESGHHSAAATSIEQLMYHRHIPADAEGEESSKTLTLFRCIMRSQHRWWFLSEADEKQPGTDRDIDYYQYKSKRHEETLPSLSGWLTCRMGADPAPSLKKIGILTTEGEEHKTLEHQLAKWAIENKLVELALGELTQKEVVEMTFPVSTELIKFLAKMCYEFDWLCDDDSFCMDTGLSSDKFCLKESHLILARENIMTTTDTLVLARIYRLLLSVHASLPEQLQEVALCITQNALMRRIQFDDPTLCELRVGSNFTADPTKDQGVSVYNPIDGADFALLSDSIGRNTHLKVAHFDGRLEEVPSDVFEGLKNNSSIKMLKLDHTSDRLGNGILGAFNERDGSLEEIALWNCEIGNDVIHTLSSTLETCSLLETINLAGNAIDDTLVENITSAIRGHRQLNELNLSGNAIGASGCEAFANLLKDPRCNLNKLNLDHNNLESDGAMLMARALPHNTSLVELSMIGNNASIMSSQDAFLKAVCDKSSVNATYLSNHTIEIVEFGVPNNEDISYWFGLHGIDVHFISTVKIIRTHPYIAMEPLFEWDVQVLPDVVSWFDDSIEAFEENERLLYEEDGDLDSIGKMKLSAIYEFARAMPLMCLPASHGLKKKRKRSTGH